LKVLITGISGQDGIFLTNKLLESDNNIEIYGTSRDYNEKKFLNSLKKIYKVKVISTENRNLSKFKILENFPQLDSNQIQKIKSLKKIYYDFNKKINLISRKDFDFFLKRYS